MPLAGLGPEQPAMALPRLSCVLFPHSPSDRGPALTSQPALCVPFLSALCSEAKPPASGQPDPHGGSYLHNHDARGGPAPRAPDP